MTFERSWALLLLLFPLAWVAWEWMRQARHAHLLLKAGVAVAVILAIAEPVVSFHSRKVALAVLVDTSASISDADLSREAALLGQIAGARGGNPVEVIPFARAPRPLGPNETAMKIGRTAGVDGRGTNLEAPLRQALASLPAGMIHRIALITDGNENEGAVTRATWQAQQLGVPVDTIALQGRPQRVQARQGRVAGPQGGAFRRHMVGPDIIRRNVLRHIDRRRPLGGLGEMQAREPAELGEQCRHLLVADLLHRGGQFLEMHRRVFLDLDGVAQEVIERGDFEAALEDAGGGGKMWRLRRQCLVALESDKDVLVADETLAGQPVARRHVVDFRVLDFLAGDLAKLAKDLLLLLGQGDAAFLLGGEMFDLHQAGPALAVLAVERNRDFVGLGNRQDGSPVAGDGIDRHVPRHHGR